MQVHHEQNCTTLLSKADNEGACLCLPVICTCHYLLPLLRARVSKRRSDTISLPKSPLQSDFPLNPKHFVSPYSLPIKVYTLWPCIQCTLESKTTFSLKLTFPVLSNPNYRSCLCKCATYIISSMPLLMLCLVCAHIHTHHFFLLTSCTSIQIVPLSS